MKIALHLTRAIAVSAVVVMGAFAQSPYPTKPIRVIVPFPPGGTTDYQARMVGQKLSKALGQPLLVENRGGAGGNIGSDVVAKSAPDGYTLVMGSVGTHSINATLYKNIPYDTLRDFAPIALAATEPNVLVANPAFPANSVQELIVLAKSKPGALSYASGSSGSSQHLSMELLKKMGGIDILHVPYKGTGPAITDVIGGQVPIMFINFDLALPHVKAGKLKALAMTDTVRSPLLPNVPTVAETLPGFVTTSWTGLFAPAGTPKEIVNRINAEVVRAVQAPELQARLLEQGFTPGTLTPEQFGPFVKAEIDKWGKVIRDSGAQVD